MPGEQDREGGRAAAGLSQAMRERACRVDVALHAVGHHEEVATTTISMFLVIFIFCKGSCHWYFSSSVAGLPLVNGQALIYCIACW